MAAPALGRRRPRLSVGARLLAGVLLVVVVLALVSLLPTLNRATLGMNEARGERVTVHYEQEEAAALEVLALADEHASAIEAALGVDEPLRYAIYVYDEQATMQRKGYGLLTALLDLDWYIGDNVGTTILLTSPANPGPAHDADTVRQALLHEMVHAATSVANPDLSYWLDNGLAGYLSDQHPPADFAVPDYPVPTLEDTRVSGLLAPLRFAGFNGYPMSFTYVEFLDRTFGWDRVRALMATGDHASSLGVDEAQVYAQWVAWLGEEYGR